MFGHQPSLFWKTHLWGLGLGNEETYVEYVENIVRFLNVAKSKMKKTGSVWLNLGDSVINGSYLDLPHRIAIKAIDDLGYFLSDIVIWDRGRGAISSCKTRLPSQYETLFHFTLDPKNFFFDGTDIRKLPKKTAVERGRVKSATGVTGLNYRRKIDASPYLSEKEKKAALKDLNGALNKIKSGGAL